MHNVKLILAMGARENVLAIQLLTLVVGLNVTDPQGRNFECFRPLTIGTLYTVRFRSPCWTLADTIHDTLAASTAAATSMTAPESGFGFIFRWVS